jgi:hypothetical protein
VCAGLSEKAPAADYPDASLLAERAQAGAQLGALVLEGFEHLGDAAPIAGTSGMRPDGGRSVR